MKPITRNRLVHPLMAAVLIAFCTCGGVKAGVDIFSIVHQPLHLGADSDPQRIPLGELPDVSNHGYGSYRSIVAARLSGPGNQADDSGRITEQNLASLFDIGLAGDLHPTDAPVSIRIVDKAKPADSPHTKAQVVAAIIHCLMLDWNLTTERPLVVKIEGEGQADVDVRSYAGSYVNDPSTGGTSTKVPGSHLETDDQGIIWVVFDKPAEQRETHGTPRPEFVPFLAPSAEGYAINALDALGVDPYEDGFCLLLPTWPAPGWTRHPCELISRPANPEYGQYNSLLDGATRAAVLRAFEWKETESHMLATLTLTKPASACPAVEHPDKAFALTTAAACYSLVLAARPEPVRPLRIELRIDPTDQPLLAQFAASKDWQTGKLNDQVTMACEFVWNSAARSLAKGSIPGYRLVRGCNGPWVVVAEMPDLKQQE